jgi:glycosyltransferase involved in cell wall biosynthesis
MGPLVSIVTPFYNAAPWLTECIASVIGQTWQEWEYILVDNASTDGSTNIAREFAATDGRIRYVRNPELLSQVRNYNTALGLISPVSRYCKIVQADDWVFPECVRSMVELFESAESIGLVSSYYLKGPRVRGDGLPYSNARLGGRDVVRRLLRDGLYVFGSPTAHMFRSSIVRVRQPFYADGRLHEDTETCIEILREWDFGFVHQVLSFLRTDNQSITSRVRPYGPKYLDRYITVRRYAPKFCEPEETAALSHQVKDFYYSFLAGCVLRMKPPQFWRYHRDGLRTIDEDLDWAFLLTRVARKLSWSIANPGLTIASAFSASKSVDIPD